MLELPATTIATGTGSKLEVAKEMAAKGGKAVQEGARVLLDDFKTVSKEVSGT